MPSVNYASWRACCHLHWFKTILFGHLDLCSQDSTLGCSAPVAVMFMVQESFIFSLIIAICCSVSYQPQMLIFPWGNGVLLNSTMMQRLDVCERLHVPASLMTYGQSLPWWQTCQRCDCIMTLPIVTSRGTFIYYSVVMRDWSLSEVRLMGEKIVWFHKYVDIFTWYESMI